MIINIYDVSTNDIKYSADFPHYLKINIFNLIGTLLIYIDFNKMIVFYDMTEQFSQVEQHYDVT